MDWALLSPWWLLAAAPLAVPVFLLLRRSDRPRPSPWAFLLRAEDRAPDWRRRRLGRLLPPFLLMLAAVVALLLVPARPARAREPLVLLRETEAFRALDSAQRAAWAAALAAWAKDRRLDAFTLEAEGRTWRVAPAGLAAFRLPEPAAAPAARRDGPPPLLTCGLDAGAHPGSDFLPWPVAPDSRAILAVGLLPDGRHQVRVRRWDAAPRPPLRLLQDGRPLAAGAGFPEDDTVVVVDLGDGPRTLALDPPDGRPWTDRASWTDPDLHRLAWRADTAVPDGLRQALDGASVGWTGQLLVTADPVRFAAHGGPAWLLCPERPLPGVVELAPVPPDSPYRVISHASLPFAARRTLFDLPLARLPAFHLAGETGTVLLSHAGRPVAARAAPGRLVQTLPFDAVRHDDADGARDLARLLLAGLGLGGDPERPAPCFAAAPPAEGPARLTAGAASPAGERDEPLVLPAALLLAALVLFAAGLWLLGRGGIMPREATA